MVALARSGPEREGIDFERMVAILSNVTGMSRDLCRVLVRGLAHAGDCELIDDPAQPSGVRVEPTARLFRDDVPTPKLPISLATGKTAGPSPRPHARLTAYLRRLLRGGEP
jgi:hypothetical protein